MAQETSKGVLYIVATPIGNLEDITYRAIRVLREVDLIACEDTRHTRKLLDQYGIDRLTISYHEHNEAERAQELVGELEQGKSIALVSDAGMPGISDPGYRLIKLAIESGLNVVPVPGPSALIAALVGSGLSTHAFEFHGFLPGKSGQRRTMLESLRRAQHTLVFYEAPHRIRETLEDIVGTLGRQRPVVIARELTKLHEEYIRGSAGEILEQIKSRELKGEMTLLIGPGPSNVAAAEKSLASRLQEIMREQKVDEKAALKIVSKERGLSRSEAYREIQRSKEK